jgi:catechol 2,3-dioxygenase-like lactoylglutathione lyase family enzyme
MFTGSHVMLYSPDPEADRAFFRDTLALPHVDAGEGWLIFRVPPAEAGIHGGPQATAGAEAPANLYLMTDDIQAFIQAMTEKSVPASPAQDMGWGVATHVTLPSGLLLGVYQPRHARPE